MKILIIISLLLSVSQSFANSKLYDIHYANLNNSKPGNISKNVQCFVDIKYASFSYERLAADSFSDDGLSYELGAEKTTHTLELRNNKLDFQSWSIPQDGVLVYQSKYIKNFSITFYYNKKTLLFEKIKSNLEGETCLL